MASPDTLCTLLHKCLEEIVDPKTSDFKYIQNFFVVSEIIENVYTRADEDILEAILGAFNPNVMRWLAAELDSDHPLSQYPLFKNSIYVILNYLLENANLSVELMVRHFLNNIKNTLADALNSEEIIEVKLSAAKCLKCISEDRIGKMRLLEQHILDFFIFDLPSPTVNKNNVFDILNNLVKQGNIDDVLPEHVEVLIEFLRKFDVDINEEDGQNDFCQNFHFKAFDFIYQYAIQRVISDNSGQKDMASMVWTYFQEMSVKVCYADYLIESKFLEWLNDNLTNIDLLNLILKCAINLIENTKKQLWLSDYHAKIIFNIIEQVIEITKDECSQNNFNLFAVLIEMFPWPPTKEFEGTFRCQTRLIKSLCNLIKYLSKVELAEEDNNNFASFTLVFTNYMHKLTYHDIEFSTYLNNSLAIQKEIFSKHNTFTNFIGLSFLNWSKTVLAETPFLSEVISCMAEIFESGDNAFWQSTSVLENFNVVADRMRICIDNNDFKMCPLVVNMIPPYKNTSFEIFIQSHTELILKFQNILLAMVNNELFKENRSDFLSFARLLACHLREMLFANCENESMLKVGHVCCAEMSVYFQSTSFEIESVTECDYEILSRCILCYVIFENDLINKIDEKVRSKFLISVKRAVEVVANFLWNVSRTYFHHEQLLPECFKILFLTVCYWIKSITTNIDEIHSSLSILRNVFGLIIMSDSTQSLKVDLASSLFVFAFDKAHKLEFLEIMSDLGVMESIISFIDAMVALPWTEKDEKVPVLRYATQLLYLMLTSNEESDILVDCENLTILLKTSIKKIPASMDVLVIKSLMALLWIKLEMPNIPDIIKSCQVNFYQVFNVFLESLQLFYTTVYYRKNAHKHVQATLYFSEQDQIIQMIFAEASNLIEQLCRTYPAILNIFIENGWAEEIVQDLYFVAGRTVGEYFQYFIQRIYLVFLSDSRSRVQFHTLFNGTGFGTICKTHGFDEIGKILGRHMK